MLQSKLSQLKESRELYMQEHNVHSPTHTNTRSASPAANLDDLKKRLERIKSKRQWSRSTTSSHPLTLWSPLVRNGPSTFLTHAVFILMFCWREREGHRTPPQIWTWLHPLCLYVVRNKTHPVETIQVFSATVIRMWVIVHQSEKLKPFSNMRGGAPVVL